MVDQLLAAAAEFGLLFAELAVLLVLVAALLGLAARRVGVARLQTWLGGGSVRGALKGMLLGFVTPFCTYSAIPVLVGMIGARVRTATVAGFLLAAPILDPVVVAILVPLFGWQATLGYVAAVSAAVFLAALAADAAHLERQLRPVRAPVPAVTAERRPAATGTCEVAADGCGSSPRDPFTDEEPWQGWRTEGRAAYRYAFALARRLAVPMTVAVALAVVIAGVVPQQLIAGLAGPDNPLAVLVAALLGVPFYVSTEAFLPIAYALHTSGMTLGAVFALVISAAGVNIPELGLLSRMMTPRLLAGYTLAIVGVAVATGYLVPLV